MIEFVETAKRKYDLFIIKNDQKELVAKLDLKYNPIVNKFFLLAEYIQECSKLLGEDFDNWYCNLVKNYRDSNYDYQILKSNLPALKDWSNKCLEGMNVDFNNYINKSKASKNSIFFDAEEIKSIIEVSNYLKIYYSLVLDVNMNLSNHLHKDAYNYLVSPISTNDIIYKLFKIVSFKTFEYNRTDRYMWDYLESIYCKTADVHIYHMFNFVMNNILVTCSPKQNPIPYLISVIDESIKWILRSIYKDQIIYSDSISTQDVYAIQGKDNLSSYAHNDCVGKILISAYNQLEDVGVSDIEAFKTLLQGQTEMSLFANYITYPILAKVLEIPYRHFMTLSVSNAYMLNIFLYSILSDEFKKEYPIITKMLLYYNKQRPIIKTTYKLKSIDVLTRTLDTFIGFKNYDVPYDQYSSIIGKISRNTYSSFITGQDIASFPLAKLEGDFIRFYNNYFKHNGFEELYDELREKIDKLI